MARVVNQFNIPYPDFKLDEVIDPEEFDANNQELINKVNEVIVVLNEDKTNKDGDHLGTWHGMTPSDASSETINGARIDVLDTRMASAESGLATTNNSLTASNARITHTENNVRNVQKELSNLVLQQEASKRVLNGHTFGTDFANASFNLNIKDTNTTLSSALTNGSNLVNVVSSTGFTIGEVVYIFDSVNVSIVTIQNISGNSLTITPAVTKSYLVESAVASSMVDLNGYFRGSAKLEESFDSTLVNWTSVGAVSVDSTWVKQGTASHKLIGSGNINTSNPASIKKTFDLTNVAYIKFDFKYQNAESAQTNPGLNSAFGVTIGAVSFSPVIPTKTFEGSHTLDVRSYTGVHTLEFGAKQVFDVFDKSFTTTVNVDNMRFLYQPTTAYLTLNTNSSDDVVMWIEAKAGISMTGKLNGVDMDRTVVGLQTQLNKTQAHGATPMAIKVDAPGLIVRKLDKIIGGYA